MAERLNEIKRKKIVADYLELGSYRAAARKNGVSPQTLSSWEKGTTYPSVIDMEHMRKVYHIEDGVDIEWRLHGEKTKGTCSHR